ncbi:MAG: dihydrolipoamide acetyltransferase family protein [Legionella sp.]
MNIFNLPDLGEGLPDAEIHEWFIKEGDTVKLEQPLVSMETAKALVDIPSPQAGKIVKLYGQVGDIIKTGNPLIIFADEHQTTPQNRDNGTVVGQLEESKQVSDDHFTIGLSNHTAVQRVRATPAARILAKKLQIDLNKITLTSQHGIISRADVEIEASKIKKILNDYQPLTGVRRAMCNTMIHSHHHVVPVSIFDEVNIQSWPAKTDITTRLIQAIIDACSQEPALNAWFDGQCNARKCFDEVHLGIAMDSDEGLFVPVIHNAQCHDQQSLRQKIELFKANLNNRNLPPEELQGGTITLSNFGKFAGRFATPIVVPPMVAIIAVGKIYSNVAINQAGQIEQHQFLPLSLSFDHRAVTGGEATRFLGALIKSLETH